MKCGSVQENIEEYLDGALEPADEMCVDIHLIQCESCRAEIHGLRRLLQAISSEIQQCRYDGDEAPLLDRFHALCNDEVRPGQLQHPTRRLIFARAIAVGEILKARFFA